MKKSATTGFKKGAAIGVVLLMACGVASNASARQHTSTSSGTISWTGNGTTLTDGTRTLTTETCDAENTPYLLWILSGSKASSATITINGTTSPMSKPNVDRRGHSTFKYLMSGTINLDTAVVSASYDDGRNRATLTISHGCLGGESEGLTVVYLGEWLFGTDSAYGELGGVLNDNGAAASLCETVNLSNCVTFSSGTTPGTSKTLSLSAPSQLTFSYSAGFLNTTAFLFDISVTATELLQLISGNASEPFPIAFANTSTMGDYSNSDTVYIVTLVGG